MSDTRTLTPDSLERLARRRAAIRMGWYVHAMVYVAVNIFLVLLSAMHGRSWAIFPAFGWGVGLAIHGFVVFMRLSGLPERLVERERRRLATQRDAW
jgi:hypothetical protein